MITISEVTRNSQPIQLSLPQCRTAPPRRAKDSPVSSLHKNGQACGKRGGFSVMPKRAVSSDRVYKSSLPFAQATIAGGFMFVCCVGCDREGRLAIGDVRAQTQQALDNIRA